ncbi:hypothetical protein L0V05_06020 [Tabrizicola sp. J26]|uniref:hypothetical protein n=1 Tax=Alitabrizicola rongguiensis TaxID=2909234 RepID=UPI001F470119|nr:hypothetical protein [Tabrizicola rongguiensis]MCF1708374.1 hypothetical protein [Tabrizicola rongguiensis]
MIRARLIPLALILAVSACGSSQARWYNPFSWWGNSEEVAGSYSALPSAADDPRPLVAQVTSMAVESTTEGVIVRATGLPATQGYWDGALLTDGPIDGKLTYRFVLVPPPEPKRVSTERSREVTVGAFIGNIELQDVREIIVQGANNARSSRR